MRTLTLLVTTLALARTALPADFSPSLQWVKTIGGTGGSTATAAAADANGNVYVVGNTYALDFPVTGAAPQRVAGGSFLARLDTSANKLENLYPAGLPTVNVLAADPHNNKLVYAAAGTAIWKTTDSAATWSQLYDFGDVGLVTAIAVDPTSSSTLYAGTASTGVFKSVDGGTTWTQRNSGIAVASGYTNSIAAIWVDPTLPQVLFASANTRLLRSADGGASWITIANYVGSLLLDPLVPGTVYLADAGKLAKSTDHGQTFASPTDLPDTGNAQLVADPLRAGVFYLAGTNGLFQTTDSAVTWTRKSGLAVPLMVVDPLNGTIYAETYSTGSGQPNLSLTKSTDGFATTTSVALPNSLRQVLLAGNTLLLLAQPTSDVFAVKFNSNGNVVYATYLGGISNDVANAMALGADGSIYIAGTTASADFPTTAGTYGSSLTASGNFVVKLNPDGTLGWSTYFANSQTTINAVALDSSGNVYIAGFTGGGLPTSTGAYQTQFQQTYLCTGFIGCFPGPTSAFVTKLNAKGSALIYSTYVPTDNHPYTVQVAQALVVDGSGNAWFGGNGNVVELDATGSKILAASSYGGISIAAITLDTNSNLYATGILAGGVLPATGGFQQGPQPAFPVLPGQLPPGGGGDVFVVKWDSGLSQIQNATLLGGELVDGAASIQLDSAGNVFVSGYTDSKAFPLHAPFQTTFSARAGFVAALDSTLSHLLFSTYLGDGRPFAAQAAAPDGNGNLMLVGSTLDPGYGFYGGDPGRTYTTGALVVVNKIALAQPRTLRLDTVVNAASRMAAPLAPGEAIVAIGSGFGTDTQIVLDGVALPTISATATAVTASVPDSAKTSGAFQVLVSSGGNLSNALYVPAAAAAPGIYSVDGSGYGPGYILNSDGTLNSVSHPAAPGSAITIVAAGAGAYTVTSGYAVTAQAPAVFVDGFYANGIGATIGPVAGLPGEVYQLSVFVPDPAKLVSANPNLLNFQFPPQVAVKLVMGTVNPLNPDNSLLISQPGIVLNIK